MRPDNPAKYSSLHGSTAFIIHNIQAHHNPKDNLKTSNGISCRERLHLQNLKCLSYSTTTSHFHQPLSHNTHFNHHRPAPPPKPQEKKHLGKVEEPIPDTLRFRTTKGFEFDMKKI